MRINYKIYKAHFHFSRRSNRSVIGVGYVILRGTFLYACPPTPRTVPECLESNYKRSKRVRKKKADKRTSSLYQKYQNLSFFRRISFYMPNFKNYRHCPCVTSYFTFSGVLLQELSFLRCPHYHLRELIRLPLFGKGIIIFRDTFFELNLTFVTSTHFSVSLISRLVA